MISTTRVAIVLAVGLGTLAVASMPAHAASTPTTTTPGRSGADLAKADELTEKAGLLLESDLPSGYELTDIRTESGRPASYPVAGADCELDHEAFAGTPPGTATATYSDDATRDDVAEVRYTFSSTKLAKSYFKSYAGGFEDLADCGKTVSPAGTIGTYRSVDLGKVGRQRSGLAFDPVGAFVAPRFAVFRTGKVVGYLGLNADDATDDEFVALVKTAEKRAR